MILMAALAVLTVPVTVQTQTPIPLAGNGPYKVGFRLVTLTDTSRDGRAMNEIIWYPATVPTNPTSQQSADVSKLGWANATADTTGAPYPMVLISHGGNGKATNFATLLMGLVTHGFVVVGLDHPGEDSAV